jgi:hypothetical protein
MSDPTNWLSGDPLRWIMHLIELHRPKPVPDNDSVETQPRIPPPSPTPPVEPPSAPPVEVSVSGSRFQIVYGNVRRERPYRGVAASAPYVPATTFYHPSVWSAEQNAYYRFWNYRLAAGEALQTDAYYLRRYADDAVILATTLEALVDDWEMLRRNYPSIWQPDLDSRIGQGRLILGRYEFGPNEKTMVFESFVLEDQGSWIGFDLAVRAGVSPRDADLKTIVEPSIPNTLRWRQRRAVIETVARLRKLADPDPIFNAALSGVPKLMSREVFRGVPDIDRLAGPGQSHLHVKRGSWGVVTAKIPSYYATARVKHAVGELVAEAMSLVVPAAEGGGTVGGDEHRFSIKRERSIVATLPPPDTVEGLIVSARLATSWEAVVLLAVVLRMCEVKPWIEGQIALARDLRIGFDRAMQSLGQTTGIGAVKRAFFSCVVGARAAWTMENVPSDAQSLKMNGARARFRRNLQRELLGSAIRESVILACEAVLVERLNVPASAVATALSGGTILKVEE